MITLKRNLLCICFTLSIVGIYAQDFQVTLGKESPPKNDIPPNKFLGEGSNGLYVYKEKRNTFESSVIYHRWLEKYDSNDLHMIFSKELDKMPKTENGNKTKFSDIFFVNGKVILISYFIDEKNSINTDKGSILYSVYATPISDQGNFGATPTLLFQERQEHSSKLSYTGFIANLTDDGNQLFFYGGVDVDGKMQWKIINSDLTMASEGKMAHSFERKYKLTNFKITKNKILYCLSKEELPKSEWFVCTKDLTITKYTHRIMSFDLLNGTSKGTVIPAKTDLPPSDFNFTYDDDVIRVVSYYYSAVDQKAKSGGIRYSQFKTGNLELISSFEKALAAPIFAQLNENIVLPGKNFVAKWNEHANAINSLIQSKIIPLSNGDHLIISEQLILSYRRDCGYDFFNLLITRVNQKGEFVSNVVIPKKQGGITTSLYSYEAFTKNNILYLVFLEDIKNMNLPNSYKLEERADGIKGTIPVVVRIDESGAWTKKALYDGENVPRTHTTISFLRKGNELLIYGQQEKNIQFLKIKY